VRLTPLGVVRVLGEPQLLLVDVAFDVALDHVQALLIAPFCVTLVVAQAPLSVTKLFLRFLTHVPHHAVDPAFGVTQVLLQRTERLGVLLAVVVDLVTKAPLGVGDVLCQPLAAESTFTAVLVDIAFDPAFRVGKVLVGVTEAVYRLAATAIDVAIQPAGVGVSTFVQVTGVRTVLLRQAPRVGILSGVQPARAIADLVFDVVDLTGKVAGVGIDVRVSATLPVTKPAGALLDAVIGAALAFVQPAAVGVDVLLYVIDFTRHPPGVLVDVCVGLALAVAEPAGFTVGLARSAEESVIDVAVGRGLALGGVLEASVDLVVEEQRVAVDLSRQVLGVTVRLGVDVAGAVGDGTV